MERFLSAPVTDAQYQRDALLVGPARSTANGPQTAAPGKFPANFWFFPRLFFRMARRASHKSRQFLFSLCIFLVLSEFGPRLAGQSR